MAGLSLRGFWIKPKVSSMLLRRLSRLPASAAMSKPLLMASTPGSSTVLRLMPSEVV